MKESQQIEWKETWRDEYLRWICGFANAEGGVLVIGRNDKGQVVGVPHAKKLLLSTHAPECRFWTGSWPRDFLREGIWPLLPVSCRVVMNRKTIKP